MKTVHNLTNEDLAWIDDAVGYGNVSTIGAAYVRLIGLRELIITGIDISFTGQSLNHYFDSTESFDDWVRSRYPVFAEDILHPTFRAKPKAEKGGGGNSSTHYTSPITLL